ncbi:hypothetical protein DKP78_19175, partial [Enterococcus faecium]
QEEPETRLRELAHTLKGEMSHVAYELKTKITEIDEKMKQCENKINALTLNKGTHVEEPDGNSHLSLRKENGIIL